MNWTNERHFVLAANFHGGDVVANYPFDGEPTLYPHNPSDQPTPDDELFRHLAKTYSFNHASMRQSGEFRDGITNGAKWYSLYGGMQDWTYLTAGCFEITLEVSFVKRPSAIQLDGFWNDNYDAMLAYLLEVHKGVKGIVQSQDKKPLAAKISIGENHMSVKTDPAHGDWYRILTPGRYSVTASADGYQSHTYSVTIPEDQQAFQAPYLTFTLAPTVAGGK
eukprot:TRINITY_DN8609_c0_g1_i2.p2 TRINITY_DN8609_c0_g1~~TRINITY_DN8609_c0_g1_i2.p2  ORF type:complete len:221 (-),score=47.41 TRINITY_DN8609_c0_g1_i2:37-699(-)